MPGRLPTAPVRGPWSSRRYRVRVGRLVVTDTSREDQFLLPFVDCFVIAVVDGTLAVVVVAATCGSVGAACNIVGAMADISDGSFG